MCLTLVAFSLFLSLIVLLRVGDAHWLLLHLVAQPQIAEAAVSLAGRVGGFSGVPTARRSHACGVMDNRWVSGFGEVVAASRRARRLRSKTQGAAVGGEPAALAAVRAATESRLQMMAAAADVGLTQEHHTQPEGPVHRPVTTEPAIYIHAYKKYKVTRSCSDSGRLFFRVCGQCGVQRAHGGIYYECVSCMGVPMCYMSYSVAPGRR